MTSMSKLKHHCCDVFIWIAVWRNKIDYWVLSNKDVQSNPLFNNQHRASQLSEDGAVMEGQIHINNVNYSEFEKYKVELKDIYNKIIETKKNTHHQDIYSGK